MSNQGCIFFYSARSLTINGIVKVEGVVSSKKIHVISVKDGELLAECISNIDGYFEIEGIPLDADIDVIVHYNAQPEMFYDDLILRIMEGEPRTELVFDFNKVVTEQYGLSIEENFGFALNLRCPETFLFWESDNVNIDIEETILFTDVICENVLIGEANPPQTVYIPEIRRSITPSLVGISLNYVVVSPEILVVVESDVEFIGYCDIVNAIHTRVGIKCNVDYRTNSLGVVNSMGISNVSLIRAGIKDVRSFYLLNQVGIFTIANFNIYGEVKGKLEGVRAKGVEVFRNKILTDNPINNLSNNIVPIGDSSLSNIRLDVSGNIEQVARVVMSVGECEQSNQVIPNSFEGFTTHQLHENIISDSASSVETIKFYPHGWLSNEQVLLQSYELLSDTNRSINEVSEGCFYVQVNSSALSTDSIFIHNNINSFEALTSQERFENRIADYKITGSEIFYNTITGNPTLQIQSLINGYGQNGSINVTANIYDGLQTNSIIKNELTNDYYINNQVNVSSMELNNSRLFVSNYIAEGLNNEQIVKMGMTECIVDSPRYMNSIAGYAPSYQTSINEVSTNILLSETNRLSISNDFISNSFNINTFGIDSSSMLLNRISDYKLFGHDIFVNKITGNPLLQTQSIINGYGQHDNLIVGAAIQDGVHSSSLIRNEVTSDKLFNLHTIINSNCNINDNSVIQLTIAEGVDGLQNVITTLSESLSINQSVLNKLSDSSELISYQQVRNTLL